MIKFDNEWDEILKDEFAQEYYLKLRNFLKYEYMNRRIFPDMHDIFNAFKYTSYSEIKVVIIGQDPYHGFGQAHGLCFSVKKGVEPPPSLKNIYKEIDKELHVGIPNHGELTKWAKQGVLLLNTVLTVREAQANSHKGMGWEIFTDHVIQKLNSRKTPIIFLLWGANARAKKSLITSPIHKILECAHPSPLSAHNGFFGCGHFIRTNQILKENGLNEIDWKID